MTRSATLSLAAALAVAFITMLGGATNRAYAQQNPNCCDFIVNVSNIPASCFPITIHTTWGGGLTHTVTFTAPGYYSVHLPFNCPPAPTFLAATVASNCCLGPITYFCGGCLFIELAFTC